MLCHRNNIKFGPFKAFKSFKLWSCRNFFEIISSCLNTQLFQQSFSRFSIKRPGEHEAEFHVNLISQQQIVKLPTKDTFVITCPERSSLDKGHTAWLILTLGHALDGGPGTLFTLGSDRWCVHQEIIVNSLNFDYFLFFSFFFFLVLDLDKSFGSKLLPALMMMMSWSADSLGPFSLIKNWITCKKLNNILILFVIFKHKY